MITNDRLINDLLILRDSVIRANKNVLIGHLFTLENEEKTLVMKIESMILGKLEGDDKRMMETFFEMDV